MSNLNGKVAVVTGASKGIGAAIAQALGTAGAAVVVNYASDKEGAERVAAAIGNAGGKAVAVHADMAKPADVTRLFAEAKDKFGRLDILVNNAAVFTFGPLDTVEPAEFHRQFTVNVLGPILAAREAARHFGPEGGSIINISSVVSVSAYTDTVIYSATKGALDAVTRVLAAELGPRGIRVNTLAPGAVITEGTQSMVGSDFHKTTIAATPLGRIGLPDDIAKIAVFLASDASAWMTGDRVTAAGGHNR